MPVTAFNDSGRAGLARDLRVGADYPASLPVRKQNLAQLLHRMAVVAARRFVGRSDHRRDLAEAETVEQVQLDDHALLRSKLGDRGGELLFDLSGDELSRAERIR